VGDRRHSCSDRNRKQNRGRRDQDQNPAVQSESRTSQQADY
jgi:hypothetical protein